MYLEENDSIPEFICCNLVMYWIIKMNSSRNMLLRSMKPESLPEQDINEAIDEFTKWKARNTKNFLNSFYKYDDG